MLENRALPALALNYNIENRNFNSIWWFQDGAPAHRTRLVRQRLINLFPEKVVALGHDVEWPARSPDLTPCDFFLWGYLKQKVFTSPPPNIQTLRERIVNEINQLRAKPEFIINSVRGMRRRAEVCIERNGQQVEGH